MARGDGAVSLKDCPLCGLPMEVKTEWTQVKPVVYGDQAAREVIDMVTAACMSGHWYGGPERDLQA